MNRIDTSSDLFVFNAFPIWGTVLETAKPVAAKPIIGNKKSTIVFRLPPFCILVLYKKIKEMHYDLVHIKDYTKVN